MSKAGKWITLVSVALALLCTLPIRLAMIFGPGDRDLAELELLMALGAPAFGLLAFLGAIIWAVGASRDRHAD